jgi:hypothetical protein
VQIPPRQRLLDAFLLPHQPVERGIEFPLIDLAQIKHLAQRVACRLVVEPARGCELGGRINKPGDDHGGAQGHLAARLASALRQQPVEPELAQLAKGCGHVSVRQAAQDAQTLPIRGSDRLIAQHPP